MMSQVKKNQLRNLLMSSNALVFFFWQIPDIPGIWLPTSEAQQVPYCPRIMALQTALLLLPLDQLPNFKASAQVQARLGRVLGR